MLEVLRLLALQARLLVLVETPRTESATLYWHLFDPAGRGDLAFEDRVLRPHPPPDAP